MIQRDMRWKAVTYAGFKQDLSTVEVTGVN